MPEQVVSNHNGEYTENRELGGKRLPNLAKLYHVPVFALRELLKDRTDGQKFSVLDHEGLVAEADRQEAVTESDVDNLYEAYRYGHSLAFYLYLLPTNLASPTLQTLQVALDKQAIPGSSDVGGSQDNVTPDRILLLDEESLNGPCEIRFRYSVPHRFINIDERPDIILQTRYGFLWLDLDIGYLSILSRDEHVNQLIARALASCVQAIPLPVRFSKDLVDEHFSIEKIRRVSHYDPGTGIRQSVSGNDLWQEFQAEIVSREQRYVRPSSLYEEEVAEGIVSGLGITASKGKIYLTRTLPTSLVRAWGLRRLPDLVRDVREMRNLHPESFNCATEAINKMRLTAVGKAAIIDIAEGLLRAKREELTNVELRQTAIEIHDALAGKYFNAYVRAQCSECDEIAEMCPHCENRALAFDKQGIKCEACGATLTEGESVQLSCLNGHTSTVAFDEAFCIAPNHWLQKRLTRIFAEIGQTWSEKEDYFRIEGRVLYWLKRGMKGQDQLPRLVQNYIQNFWKPVAGPIHLGGGDMVVEAASSDQGNGSGQGYKSFDMRLRGNAQIGYTIEASISEGGSVSPQPLLLPGDSVFGHQLKQVLHQKADKDSMRSVGESLFGALFPPRIVKLWARAKGGLNNGGGLRLRLRLDSPGLMKVPWELMYEDEYVGLRPRYPIVRYLDLPDPPQPLVVEPPLRVLVAVSQPTDAQILAVDAELSNIQKALEPLADKVEMDVLQSARRGQLLSKLRDGYHILHYVGHGAFDGNEGYLVLEDEQGRADYMSASLVGSLVADSSLCLAVLNACQTSKVSLGSGLGSVAHHLVKAGMPAVIAMQSNIADLAAVAFSREFYGALADGWPVDASVQEGRRGIAAALGNHWNARLDWAIPTLYMRAPDGVILGAKVAAPER